jgi:hypothetical protein
MKKNKLKIVLFFFLFCAILLWTLSQLGDGARGALLWVMRFAPAHTMILTSDEYFCEIGVEKIKATSAEKRKQELIPLYLELFSPDPEVAKNAVKKRQTFSFLSGSSYQPDIFDSHFAGPWKCLGKTLSVMGDEAAPLVQPMMNFALKHPQEARELMYQGFGDTVARSNIVAAEILKTLQYSNLSEEWNKWNLFNHASLAILPEFLKWLQSQPPLTYLVEESEKLKTNPQALSHISYTNSGQPYLVIISNSLAALGAVDRPILDFLANPQNSPDKKMSILIALNDAKTPLNKLEEIMPALLKDPDPGVRYYALALLIFKAADIPQGPSLVISEISRNISSSTFSRQEDWQYLEILQAFFTQLSYGPLKIDATSIAKDVPVLESALANLLKVAPAKSEKTQSFITNVMRSPYGSYLEKFWQGFLTGPSRDYALLGLSKMTVSSPVLEKELVSMLQSKKTGELEQAINLTDTVYRNEQKRLSAIPDTLFKQLLLTFISSENPYRPAENLYQLKIKGLLYDNKERAALLAKSLLTAKKKNYNLASLKTLILYLDPQKKNYESLRDELSKMNKCDTTWAEIWGQLLTYLNDNKDSFDPLPFNLMLERCDPTAWPMFLHPLSQATQTFPTLRELLTTWQTKNPNHALGPKVKELLEVRTEETNENYNESEE